MVAVLANRSPAGAGGQRPGGPPGGGGGFSGPPPGVFAGGFGGGPGGGGRGFGGGPGGGPGGFQPGRWSFSVFHTIKLDDQITLAQGLAPIDLLEGGSIDDSGGGRRHLVDFEGGASFLGAGFRLIGNWRRHALLEPAPLGRQIRTCSLTTSSTSISASSSPHPHAQT
jgi:hypothetical protein